MYLSKHMPVLCLIGNLFIYLQFGSSLCSTFSGLVPLFGIDVWEHAYYLQYKNVRPDYMKAIFDIANWEEAGRRLAEARLNA